MLAISPWYNESSRLAPNVRFAPFPPRYVSGRGSLMSTISNKQPRNSSTRTRRNPPRSDQASFAYGWRYVARPGRNGRTEWARIPLTLEDVLHPQEADVLVPGDPHADDCTYLR